MRVRENTTTRGYSSHCCLNAIWDPRTPCRYRQLVFLSPAYLQVAKPVMEMVVGPDAMVDVHLTAVSGVSGKTCRRGCGDAAGARARPRRG